MKKYLKSIIAITLFFTSSNLLANSYYVKQDVTIKDEKNKVIGELTKGTKVKVLKKSIDKSLIEIRGWSYEEKPNNKIFFKDGITVVLANIKKDKLLLRKTLQTKEDEYEESWIETKIEAWISNKELTQDFMSLWDKEKSLAAERCSGCHEIPAPDSHFAGEFPSLMDSMAEQAGLGEVEKTTLINYFQKRNIYKQ